MMAGENATNDVDEEVYDNDGAERNEAQEASAGDRRAIADADQAGQLDISGEAKTARSLRTPEPPTDAVRMAHNATHVPFREWLVVVCKMIQWMTSDFFLRKIQRHVRRCAVLMCTENDTRTCTCVQQKN